jgi:GNAT superfamily N-acetyltransferase
MTGSPSVQLVSPAEVPSTFAVMAELRPHLDQAGYVQAVSRMMTAGFRLAAVREAGQVVAVAGFRVSESLAWGRYLYVDDLVTGDGGRSQGYGKVLLDWLKAEARSAGCGELHLDSGVQRHGAHRFYLRERLDITSYHFRVTL